MEVAFGVHAAMQRLAQETNVALLLTWDCRRGLTIIVAPLEMATDHNSMCHYGVRLSMSGGKPVR